MLRVLYAILFCLIIQLGSNQVAWAAGEEGIAEFYLRESSPDTVYYVLNPTSKGELKRDRVECNFQVRNTGTEGSVSYSVYKYRGGQISGHAILTGCVGVGEIPIEKTLLCDGEVAICLKKEQRWRKTSSWCQFFLDRDMESYFCGEGSILVSRKVKVD